MADGSCCSFTDVTERKETAGDLLLLPQILDFQEKVNPTQQLPPWHQSRSADSQLVSLSLRFPVISIMEGLCL